MNMSNNSSDIIEISSNSSMKITMNKDLKLSFDILIIFTVITIMIAMGANIHWMEIWKSIRHPIGPLIGVICQFVLMPLIGFVCNKIFHLETDIAVGLLIVTCCPGGGFSNIFTYYLDGDVALSVTMTTISTILALGFMPLNVWIYRKDTEASKLIIPYKNIAISLAIMTSPIILGMLVKWKMPKIAVYVTKYGSILGFVCVTSAVVIEVILFLPQIYVLSIEIYLILILPNVSGFLAGYFIAFVSRRSVSICKAIAIESGIQSIVVAFGVATLSFDIRKRPLTLLIPLLCGVYEIIFIILACIVYHIVIHIVKKLRSEETTESEEDRAQELKLI